MANHRQPETFQGTRHGTAVALITHEDLTAAAATETIPWATLVAAHGGEAIPTDARLMFAYARLIEPFSGGTTATAVVDLGDTAAPTELIVGHDVFTGAPLGVGATPGAYATGVAIEADYETAGAAVRVTITGDTVDNLDAGRAEVRIIYQALEGDALV